ncbi:MAG TPA: hypothetical protein VI197_02080 [Polyangiaceae bacterium]
MPLPHVHVEYLKVDLCRESVEVEPNAFVATTNSGDSVIVRLSSDVFAARFDVHKTPTPENPKARTLLVRASELDYRRMLREAITEGQMAISYRQVK